MKKVIVAINFMVDHSQQTLEDSLADHPQIMKYFKKKKAIQLSANVYLFDSDEDAEKIQGDLTPFLDRSEYVYVFIADISDWMAFSDKKTLAALSKSFPVTA